MNDLAREIRSTARLYGTWHGNLLEGKVEKASPVLKRQLRMQTKKVQKSYRNFAREATKMKELTDKLD